MSDINNAVEALTSADTISFSGVISNDDALLLFNIANKVGAKLFCRDCYGYNTFVDAYSHISKKKISSVKLEDIKDSDLIIAFGSRFCDNDSKICKTLKDSSAKLIYMHPIEDTRLENIEQFIKYEPGSEEGVVALLLELLTRDKELPEYLKDYIEELDIGFLSGESSISEEELEELLTKLQDKKRVTFVVGSDVFNHQEVANIAKILALVEKHSNFELFVASPSEKTEGVRAVAKLTKEPIGKVVEVSESIREIARALNVENKELPKVAQDEELESKVELNDVEELPSFDGVVIYCVDNLHENSLIGTKQFSMAAKVSNGDSVEFKIDGNSLKRVFSIDTSLKGTIALNPTFDMGLSGFTVSSYRFCKIDINKSREC